jgi:alkylation response protein AidB-like acyl-CoA dehydrogenase
MSSTASAIARLDSQKVSGGLRVSGQLRFSSGCDAAEWFLMIIPDGMSLAPRADVEVLDEWHVSGLRGTGSKSIVFEDVFIPDYRTVSLEALLSGQSFGAELYPDNPFYRTPMNITLNTLLLAATVGTANGLVELFSDRALARVDGHTGQKAFERPGTQLRFAEAAATVDAAMLIERTVLSDLIDLGRSGAVPPEDRARIRRNVCFATRLAVTAADLLLEAGDASGQYDHQLVQRWGRDVHMAGLQASLTWDETAMSWSQLHWGLEPQSRLL